MPSVPVLAEYALFVKSTLPLKVEWCLEPLPVGTQPDNLVEVDWDQRRLRTEQSLSGEWSREPSLDRERYSPGGNCGGPSGGLPLDWGADDSGATGTGRDITSRAACRSSGMEGT